MEMIDTSVVQRRRSLFGDSHDPAKSIPAM